MITIKTFEKFFPKITPIVQYGGKPHKLIACRTIYYLNQLTGDTDIKHFEVDLEPLAG